MNPRLALRAIKACHSLAWAFFVVCILAIPYFAWQQRFGAVLVASAFVLLEIVILLFNSMKCPLTAIAARYTSDRRDNFDIYLPAPIARHNKSIFGTILAAGWLYTLIKWLFS
jgi:hypothetical protein